MAKDFYNLLGVQKSASKDEIKKAYRTLAHKYHPDKQGGDEAKFKEINEAYSVLSDDQKRAQYDQFGQTFSGGGAGQGGFGGFEGFDFSQFTQGGQGGNFDFDLNDILGSFFGGRGGRGRVRKGADISVDVEIEFKDSVLGVSRDVDVRRNDGSREKIKLNVPPGIDSGEMIRYNKKGESIDGGVPGDLYVRIHVRPHKKLHKEGYHIVTEETIKISESILGTKRDIESVDGIITVKIPEGIQHGELLRVKGRGVPVSTHQNGDLLIKINIESPRKISKKAREAIEILQQEGL